MGEPRSKSLLTQRMAGRLPVNRLAPFKTDNNAQLDLGKSDGTRIFPFRGPAGSIKTKRDHLDSLFRTGATGFEYHPLLGTRRLVKRKDLSLRKVF